MAGPRSLLVVVAPCYNEAEVVGQFYDALKPILEPTTPPVSVGCPDVLALWSRKLEGELSTFDCAQMERHLTTCPSCTSACTALKAALLACRNARSKVVAPEVKAIVKGAIRNWIESDCGNRA